MMKNKCVDCPTSNNIANNNTANVNSNINVNNNANINNTDNVSGQNSYSTNNILENTNTTTNARNNNILNNTNSNSNINSYSNNSNSYANTTHANTTTENLNLNYDTITPVLQKDVEEFENLKQAYLACLRSDGDKRQKCRDIIGQIKKSKNQVTKNSFEFFNGAIEKLDKEIENLEKQLTQAQDEKSRQEIQRKLVESRSVKKTTLGVLQSITYQQAQNINNINNIVQIQPQTQPVVTQRQVTNEKKCGRFDWSCVLGKAVRKYGWKHILSRFGDNNDVNKGEPPVGH